MLIFFGIAPVLFIFNSYNVHWFYRELNSLHIGLKIKHIFNMKVDHICVGTREIQSTTSRWSWRRWHWQCRPDTWKPRSTYIEWIVNKRQTTIIILKHVLDFGCRIPHTGCWRHFQNTTKRRSGIAKNSKLFYAKYGECTSNHFGSVRGALWRIFSKYILFLAHVSVVLP